MSSITYLERAKIALKYGIPHMPLQAAKKIPILALGSWKERNLPTTDTKQDEIWNQSYPDANIAWVAFARPDGFIIFEADREGLLDKIARDTGHEISPLTTLSQRSRQGRGHLVFRQTAKSIAVGNLQQKDESGEIWSLRSDWRYIVGPGSIHPITGLQYELVSDVTPVDIPDWLVDWCVKNNSSDSDTAAKVKDPVDATPNGPPIPHGSHDDELFRVACKLRQIGMEEDAIYTALVEICEKRCVNYGSDYLDMCRNKARSACRYEPGKNGLVLVTTGNGRPAMVSEDAEPLEVDRSEITPRPVFPYWVIQGTSVGDGFVMPTAASSSKHPEFLFMAAVQTFLIHLSQRVKIENFASNNLNLYLGFISPYGKFFKSSSSEAAHAFFRSMGYLNIYTPKMINADGRTLVVQSGSPEGFALAMSQVNCTHGILFHDELSKLVSKSSIKGSSFLSDLLTWYESGTFMNRIKDSKASYSFEAGTYTFGWNWCTTDRGFTRLWPEIAEQESGMLDRHFFVICPKDPKPLVKARDINLTAAAGITFKLIADATGKTYRFGASAQDEIYRCFQDPRSASLVEKLALYFAIDTGHADSEIDEDAVERAIALVRYRNQVTEFLSPVEAFNSEGRFQKTILRELRRNGGEMNRRTLLRQLSYQDYGTSSALKWFNALFQGADSPVFERDGDVPTNGGRRPKLVCLRKFND